MCEGSFQLDVTDLSGVGGGNLVLASSNEFGYRVNVTNVAEDTAVSPVLIIRLPQQTRLSRTVCYVRMWVGCCPHSWEGILPSLVSLLHP